MLHDHDLGLSHDLATLSTAVLRRRRMLGWLAGATALPLSACGGTDDAGITPADAEASTTIEARCAVIPEETAGPFPGDGSNTVNGSVANVLTESGIVRSDIRSSIGGLSGTAAGVPLTVRLNVVNARAGCTSLEGYAIYIWQCDREGRYSLYSTGVTDQNYLRGVQASDSLGQLSFTTIFPGCYPGRVPHLHFEVYRSLASATSAASKLKTSQIAFPIDVCSAVYASAGYGASAANLRRVSFARDGVFRDGVSLQLATMSGSLDSGYVATLQVGVSA